MTATCAHLLPQTSLVMKTMVPSMALSVALAYGAPFPDHTHKAAVVRAPRLGAFTLMTSSVFKRMRQTWALQTLEAAVPSE